MDLSLARVSVRDATDRVTALFTSLPDPAITAYRSTWTAADVAAHLVIAGSSYVQYLRGDATPVVHVTSVNADNASNLATEQERDVGVLAREIASATDHFLELTEGMSPDTELPFHGVTATIGSVYGTWLSELLVHGWDVARAARRRWPIDREEAALAIEGAALNSAHFVDHEKAAELRATYELRLRRGPTLGFHFDDGSLPVTRGSVPEADCRMSGDPRAVLFVMFHRKSQWSQAALGRLVAFGRKPWLGLRFPNLFSGF